MRYILPNVMAVIIVLATLQLGAAEATISFLGFGIPPPFPSWGRMLSTDGLLLMRRDPWLALWPGFAIFLVVFGFNIFGDALRDVLDPPARRPLILPGTRPTVSSVVGSRTTGHDFLTGGHAIHQPALNSQKPSSRG